ncbi:MAG: PEP-CTERM sorting domain-containing protein [Proteobacteria bacterium]|nr:PEP-CTERM sorting domain-containing protein [Pseudomonadota bacterium]MBS0555477.1 PEP-CTERM sorting domain-containing protein [Pseudomonadota bacterium]
MFPRISLTLTAAAVLALAPAVAQAATNWSFNLQSTAPTSTTPGDASSYGNSRTYTASGVTVGVSAYSNTGINPGAAGQVTQDNSNANQLETARLAYDPTWQGLGAYNRDAGGTSTGTAGTDYQEGQSPEHSFDNNERADSALLSFGTSVNLTSITFGWWNTDSDFYVLAYTGAGTPTLTGLTYATLSGWTLVGNYSNAGGSTAGGAFTTTLGTAVTSSYWLIGAGGFTVGTGVNSGDVSGGSYLALDSTSTTKRFDYLKLTSIAGTTNGGTFPPAGVPEPGSLALAGAAFVGMMGLRRRKAVA